MTTNIFNTKSSAIQTLFKTTYFMYMKYLKIFSSFFLRVTNIRNFLEKFKDIYNNCQIIIFEKIYYLILYYKIFITKYIKSIISFS